MSQKASFFVLLAIIGVTGFMFYRVMIGFLLPLFLAAVLVVIFHPLHVRMVRRCRGRERLAALLTTATITLIVMLPIMLVIVLAAVEGSYLVTRMHLAEVSEKLAHLRDRYPALRMPAAATWHGIDATFARLADSEPRDGPLPQYQIRRLRSALDDLRNTEHPTTTLSGELFVEIAETLDRLAAADVPAADPELATPSIAFVEAQFAALKRELLGGPINAWIKESANPTDEQVQSLTQEVLEQSRRTLFSIGGRTTAFATRLVLTVLITMLGVYFFLVDGPTMVRTVMRLSPLDDRYEQELLVEFESISRAVVVATLLSALVQGLLAAFGYWLAGLDAVFLLMLLTTVFAMIPFVGTATIWVPTCLWLYFYEGRPTAALLLAVYGAAIVSAADNVIKPLVLHGQSKLHPLFALLSVLGGVQALGPIGIFVGPMVVVFLQTLLNILHRELTAMEPPPAPAAAATGSGVES